MLSLLMFGPGDMIQSLACVKLAFTPAPYFIEEKFTELKITILAWAL